MLIAGKFKPKRFWKVFEHFSKVFFSNQTQSYIYQCKQEDSIPGRREFIYSKENYCYVQLFFSLDIRNFLVVKCIKQK